MSKDAGKQHPHNENGPERHGHACGCGSDSGENRDHGHAHGEHTHEHSQPHQHAHAHGHHGHPHRHGRKTDGPILTVRAASGLSGDMMLAGLAGVAGLETKSLDAFVRELNLPALEGCLALESRSVNHIAGVGARITLPHEHAHRSAADIKTIIAASAMPDDAKELSLRAFTLLAEAEGAVHGRQADEVTFHEVGALDSILDTCMTCRLFTVIRPTRFICSPLPLADGVIRCAHGYVHSPAPAVLRLLEGVPVTGFAGTGETVTPTALSLLKALGAEFDGWPAMTVEKTVISYGTKVFADAPNGAVWALGRP